MRFWGARLVGAEDGDVVVVVPRNDQAVVPIDGEQAAGDRAPRDAGSGREDCDERLPPRRKAGGVA
mgnify:CR=1 FL=1